MQTHRETAEKRSNEFLTPARWAREALRYFVNERSARGLGGLDPFLAKRARKVVSVSGIPIYQPDVYPKYDTWVRLVLAPNAIHLIERLLDVGDVRQLAELAMPVSITEADQASAPLIPIAKYQFVERITNENLGVALTLTVNADGEAFTLWMGYV